MLILTAFNSSYSQVGEICAGSIARYCARTGSKFISKIIPDDYARNPSWFKVDFIRENLAGNDFVLWVDADAMIVDSHGKFEDILQPSTLNISKDENGINCGVMAWNNSQQSSDSLLRIATLHDEFKDSGWWEQSALMSFIEELDVHYQPKFVFNAYTNDLGPETRIVHFPGFSQDEKIILMKAQQIGFDRNGRGAT